MFIRKQTSSCILLLLKKIKKHGVWVKEEDKVAVKELALVSYVNIIGVTYNLSEINNKSVSDHHGHRQVVLI